jgi:hypothetical protein
MYVGRQVSRAAEGRVGQCMAGCSRAEEKGREREEGCLRNEDHHDSCLCSVSSFHATTRPSVRSATVGEQRASSFFTSLPGALQQSYELFTKRM